MQKRKSAFSNLILVNTMSPIRSKQNFFIIDLHYIAPFEDIDLLLDAHIDFLEENYACGRFIASGPKVPRTGGIIIATAETRAALEEALEADPFKKNQMARYTVTEFRPSKKADQLNC